MPVFPAQTVRILVSMLLVTACCCSKATAGAGNDAASEKGPIYYLDLSELEKVGTADVQPLRRVWDTLHLAASVQGIVNRQEATLFVRVMPQADDFWFDELRKEGNWLAGRPVQKVQSIEELLTIFQKSLSGVVVYREENRSTSNVASTIAGVEDRVCLRYDAAPDSIYSRVMATELPLTKNVVKLFGEDGKSLFTGQAGTTIPDTGTPGIPSSGSAKCDAYLWALHRYGRDGGVSPKYLAYYIDTYWLTSAVRFGTLSCTLTNHDFFIANRAFFLDLLMWDDETPVDDPNQPLGADVRTLQTILRSTHDRNGGKIFTMGGFVPWLWKYTNEPGAGSKYGGVDSEWQLVKITSAYNAILDADALGLPTLANASFYQHFPLKDHYPQNRRPTADDLKAQGFIDADGRVAPYAFAMFYMGDYDSSAWLNWHIPLWWRDPARGTIPCAWAINPNLDQRCPHVLDYVRTHQTEQDWFISGDSGAGYLNPGMLMTPRLDPQVPDALDIWTEHNLEYYRRYDLSITGFLIEGFAPSMGRRGLDAYQKFSPDGLIGHKVPPRGLHNGSMPYLTMMVDLYGEPPQVGKQIASYVGGELPAFWAMRTILKSPTWHKETMECARKSENGEKIRFVDPYTFFLLLKTDIQNRSEKGPSPVNTGQ